MKYPSLAANDKLRTRISQPHIQEIIFYCIVQPTPTLGHAGIYIGLAYLSTQDRFIHMTSPRQNQ